MSKDNEGLSIGSKAIGLHFRKKRFKAFPNSVHFLIGHKAYKQAGIFRKTQLFQGNIKVQPRIQALYLGTEGGCFTVKRGHPISQGIHPFRDLLTRLTGR